MNQFIELKNEFIRIEFIELKNEFIRVDQICRFHIVPANYVGGKMLRIFLKEQSKVDILYNDDESLKSDINYLKSQFFFTHNRNKAKN